MKINTFVRSRSFGRLFLLSLIVIQACSGHSVRLCTYNVGAVSKFEHSSIAGICGELRSIAPDIVSLNELDSCTLRPGGVYQLQDISEGLGGWNFSYAPAMPYRGGAYGIGISSKEKIVDSFSVVLEKGAGSEPRALAVVETDDYVFASTHLEYSDETAQMNQARQITDILASRYASCGKAVFLAGDFNATPTSPTLHYLAEKWTVLSPVDKGTFPGSDECIDFIMLLKGSGKVRVKSAKVHSDCTMSDHFPVSVEVVL